MKTALLDSKIYVKNCRKPKTSYTMTYMVSLSTILHGDPEPWANLGGGLPDSNEPPNAFVPVTKA